MRLRLDRAANDQQRLVVAGSLALVASSGADKTLVFRTSATPERSVAVGMLWHVVWGHGTIELLHQSAEAK